MIKLKATAALLAITLTAVNVPAAFAGTQQATLAVTASVPASCTISVAPLNISYDPISANASTDSTLTTPLTLNCTVGSTAIITLNQGANAPTGGSSTDAAPIRRASFTSGGTTSYLNYNLFKPDGQTLWGNTAGVLPGSGEGTPGDGGTGVVYLGTGSSDSTIEITAIIPKGQSGLPAGSYTDSVTATITF